MSEISARIWFGFRSDAGLLRLGNGRLWVASVAMTALPVEVTDAGGILKGSGYCLSAQRRHLAFSSFSRRTVSSSSMARSAAVSASVFPVEIVIFPDVLFERSVSDVAGIEDDIVGERLEIGHAEIGAGGLQCIEKKASGFVLDLLGDKQAHDLHESDLDGVGVFEDGKNEGGNAAAGAVGTELDAFVLKAFVEKAEAVAAESGRSALSAIDFEMLTSVGIICHEGLLPLPG